MTEFNLMKIPSLDTWRGSLSKRLANALPVGTVVEFVAESVPEAGEIRRSIRIHLAGRATVRVVLRFPESLDVVLDRVREAIK